MGAFLLAALIFALFCALMLYITRTSFRNLLRLRKEGVDLNATITGLQLLPEPQGLQGPWSRPKPIPLIRYSYEYDGQSYEGAANLKKKQFEQLEWGTLVPIRIVPSSPTVSMLMLNNPMRMMLIGVITSAVLTLATLGLALMMVTQAVTQ